MTQFIYRYIDIIALALTALFPLVGTIQLKRKAGRNLRAVPAYLFLSGPCGSLAFIFFHLFENVYRGIVFAIDGTFQYTFRYYSLILIGVVVGYLGINFLNACRRKCLGQPGANRSYFIQLFLMLLFTVPMIPLISIAAVPLYCCGVSLAGFSFVSRKQVQMPIIRQQTPVAIRA